MRGQLQLIIETIFVTCVIWVYADLASHDSKDFPCIVELSVPTESDHLVKVLGSARRPEKPATFRSVVSLSGSKAALQELDKEVAEGTLPRVVIAVDEAVGPAVLEPTRIESAIKIWARDHGLQTVDLHVQPISYLVDRWMRVDVEVTADAGSFARQLARPPRVEPAEVTAEILASAFERGGLSARRVVIPISEELRARSDEVVILEASVEQAFQEQHPSALTPTGERIRFIPDRVTITVQRRQGFRTQRLTAIPLRELWPSDRPAGHFRVVYENDADLVQHIDVSIPIGKAEPLSNTDVIAYVELELADFPAPEDGSEPAVGRTREGIPREVHFIFPPGFEDVRVESPPPVRLKVVRVDE